MSSKGRKLDASSTKKQNAGLRKDVQGAIDRVWPDGIVDMFFDSDESYFHDVHAKLSRAVQRIPRAQLLDEREAIPEPVWYDDSDPEEHPPDDIGHSRSYHRFFVSPEGEAFTFETEADGIAESELITGEFEEAEWEEDPLASPTPGKGRTGWVVAVSLLAPFAVIELAEVITFEDDGPTEPEIESYAQNSDGEPINLEEHFRKVKGAEPYQILVTLRAKISDILGKCGIAVLPAEEWRKPVPWLRGGSDTLLALEGKPARVLDAFFFREP